MRRFLFWSKLIQNQHFYILKVFDSRLSGLLFQKNMQKHFMQYCNIFKYGRESQNWQFLKVSWRERTNFRSLSFLCILKKIFLLGYRLLHMRQFFTIIYTFFHISFFFFRIRSVSPFPIYTVFDIILKKVLLHYSSTIQYILISLYAT